MLFLANIQPDLQREVREQCADAKFVALDSMNLWIETARDSLLKTIETVDCVLLNDAEIRQLTRKPNLVQAARELRALGPKVVVAKQGEYGAALLTDEGFFGLPAFPLETVLDPTGAGDSFAGGFVGCIAAHGGDDVSPRDAAPRDGLRHRDRLLQRRGVRHRARAAPDARGDRRARAASCSRSRSSPTRRSRCAPDAAGAGCAAARGGYHRARWSGRDSCS